MIVRYELNKLNSLIIDILHENSNNISKELISYLTEKSKKLRSMFIFLFTKALRYKVSDDIYNIALGVEFIHNSSLIHDDIIDKAELRRGNLSLNSKLGNSLSVLAGDLLLSIALKLITKSKNYEIIDIFADCLYKMSNGEINQNLNINKIISIDEYIKKSEYKTAELFIAALSSLCSILNISNKNIVDFAYNFGIAFQIKDDLLNILGTDKTKPKLSDIYNGIFTIPVIYLNEEININTLDKEEIISLVQNEKYIKKTKSIIKEYALRAIKSVDFIPDNAYKNKIIEITKNLYEDKINE